MSRRAFGLRAWMIQRLTALYLAGYFIFLVFHFSLQPPADYEAWSAWVSGPWVTNTAALFIVALLIHAWVGIRDVLMDYVKPTWVRLLAMAVVAAGLVVCGLWFARILLQ